MKRFLLSFLILGACSIGTAAASTAEISLQYSSYGSGIFGASSSSNPMLTVNSNNQGLVANGNPVRLGQLSNKNAETLSSGRPTGGGVSQLAPLYRNRSLLIFGKALNLYIAAESIPEPALLLMLGVGLLGIAALIHMFSAGLTGKSSRLG